MKGNEVLDSITVLLIFLMAVITQIFLISLTTILLKKIKIIIKSTPKKYYYFVLFYIVSKMILCIILEVKIIIGWPNEGKAIESQDVESIFKNSLIFADCAIIELFLISFQHYLNLSFSLMGNQRVQSIIKVLMQVVQIVTFFTIIIPLLIFNMGIVSYELLNDFMMCLNCLSVLSFLVSFFFMNFKMTGLLMEKKSSQLIKKVYKLLLTILLSRAIIASLEILVSIEIKNGNFEDFITIIQQNQGKYVTLGLCFILYMLIILITQGLPLMISLRQSFVAAFTSAKTLKRKSLITDDDTIRQELLQNLDEIEQMKMKKSQLDKISTIEDINGLEKIDGTENYSIFKGSFSGEKMFIRQMANISNYIVEEIIQEINDLKKLNIESMNEIKIILEGDKLYIIENFLKTNIKTHMFQIKSYDEKIQLAIQIGEAINEFHNEKYPHGSLNPQNIFVDNGNVYITGYGLQSLRKYLSLIDQYSNLTLYTAIELLGKRQKIVVKPTKEADIYSFGIILYELITGIKSYRELSLWDIRKKFKQENFRPKIPEETDQRIKKLLRMCWQENPKDRPNIYEILEILKKISKVSL